MDYYWVIDSTYTNGSRSWYVISSAGTDWSLKVFFDDIILYTGAGIFGMTDFGLAIITFLFIFLFVGIMSYKFGLVSPVGISSLIFTLVLFLDVGIGLMDEFIYSTPLISAIPHFPTIFIGFILMGTLFMEVYK